VCVFVIGLGSLRVFGRWLPPSPFDLLHELPGFVAVGIPGRFWGYLALPLAVASAIGVRALERSGADDASPVLWTFLFVSALGFQLVSISAPFLSPAGRRVVVQAGVPRSVSRIRIVSGFASQASTITPTIGVLNAYNSQEYVHGDIVSGAALVRTSHDGGFGLLEATANWNGWSAIRVELPEGARAGALIVFNENFHPRWSTSIGVITRNGAGNLCLRLHDALGPGQKIDVTFRDSNSIIGGRVSLITAFCAAILGLTVVSQAAAA
jgi:hypothetical protein